LPFTYPIGIFVGFSSIAFMTTSTAIVQLRSDPSMRGRVLALPVGRVSLALFLR
jgi:hypothetical protein